MESPADHEWFLRKHEDGSSFGPLAFAQVAPHDSLSTDQTTWMKAPMLPELAMDWIAEVTSERLYGPTTLGAIREFLRLGEIDDETFVVNTCDGTRKQIREIAPLFQTETNREEEQTSNEFLAGPATRGMSIGVEDRIRELEQALREERRAVVEAEARYRRLEAKYNQVLDAAAATST